MDCLPWLVVSLQTWGFPVMSNFTHALELELLLPFNRGLALPLHLVYDIWPYFALPQDHSLNILIFLSFPFILLPEYFPVHLLFSRHYSCNAFFNALFILCFSFLSSAEVLRMFCSSSDLWGIFFFFFFWCTSCVTRTALIFHTNTMEYGSQQ